MASQRKAGAVLSYVSLMVNAIVAFIYVPLLLSALTTAEYGVYELIGSLIAYLSVMDMGLSATLNRFFVKEKVSGSKESVENLLSMSAMIYGVLTGLALTLCAVFYSLIGQVFGASFTSGEIDLAKSMMLLVGINCIIVLPNNWYLALINANERFIFARGFSIFKYLLQVFTVVCVLYLRDGGALEVLEVQVACNAVSLLVHIVYVRKKLGIRSKFHRWDWSLFKRLFAFSFFILLNMVFDQVFWKTGQVVLGAVCGAVEVAVYGIVCKFITSAYMQISNGAASVFLPKLTSISARTEDMSEINDLFVRIGRIQAILTWAVLGGFIVLGREFIFLWAGSDFSDAYTAIVILMLGLSIALTQNLGITILQAKNKMGFRSVVYTLLSLLNLVISIPVSRAYGVVGCATVTSVLVFVGTGPIINVYYKRVIGIDVVRFFREALPLVVPVVVTSVVLAVANALFPSDYSWFDFAIKFSLFLILYCMVLWPFLSSYEKDLIRGPIERLRR